MKHVSVLCGGRGGTPLLKALLAHPSIGRVSAIINGYDDGLSTGLLRRAMPWMLGPSDFRKVCTALGQNELACRRMEDRVPVSRLEDVTQNVIKIDDSDIVKTIDLIIKLVREQVERDGAGEQDMVVGNIIFAALFDRRQDLGRAVDAFKAFTQAPERLNIVPASSTPAAIIGHTMGAAGVLTSESAIVRSLHPISSVMITPFVEADIAAFDAIETSDAVIFAPGTFHSSLLPTVLLLLPALRSLNVPIIWVVNGTDDSGTQGCAWEDLLMQVFGLPTHVVIDPRSALALGQINPQSVKTPWGYRTATPVTVEGVLNDDKSLHDGPKLVEAIQHLW